MTETVSPDLARKALHEEHQRLHDLVLRMSESRDLEDLVSALETLHPLLRKHFAHEENPGGLVGSNRYVRSMTAKQVKRTELMINYDSLIVYEDGRRLEAAPGAGPHPRGASLRPADAREAT